MGVDVGAAASAAFGGSEEAPAAAGGATAGEVAAEGAAAEEAEGQEACHVEAEPAAVAQAAALAQGAASAEGKLEQASWGDGRVEGKLSCLFRSPGGSNEQYAPQPFLPKALNTSVLPNPPHLYRCSWCGPAAAPQPLPLSAPPSGSQLRWARCKCG